MRNVLVYAERDAVTLELLTFAADLGCPVSVALFGRTTTARAGACFAHGADLAYTSNDPALADLQADVVAQALAQIAEQAGADVVLVGSTLRGREVGARLAQKLGAGCITDANGLRVEDGRLVATRYALGGNTLSCEVITSEKQVIAVMPKTFSPPSPPPPAVEGEVIEVALTLAPSPVTVVERRAKAVGAVNVEDADVLICIGRGVNEADDLPAIQALADALGGVVGCTRPISHDNHWLSEDQMVGISGKMASPRLYVGVGVSGQIQHTVGVRGSSVTVAINKDKNALIFQMADYGIVGDLYEVVPKLTEKLRAK
jgi:electron transfer flavoprotein alpha subunit